MANEKLFYLKDDFFKWLNNNGIKSYDQYGNYVIYVIALFDENGLAKTLNDLESAFKLDKNLTLDLVRNVSIILRNLHKKKGANLKFNHKLTKKSLQDYYSGIKAYYNFLREKSEDTTAKIKWNNKYKEEADIIYALANQVDGTDSLLHLLKVDDEFEFVHEVLKESYFFFPTDVVERFDKIADKYEQKDKMDARWTETYKSEKKEGKSEKRGVYVEGKSKKEIKDSSKTSNDILFFDGVNEIPVKIDEDGNKAVRSLIEDTTGHKVSAGKDSTFQFYKISHIWGDAYDPRYFTNLWNLVLVPAWANDLLDKTNSNDKLTRLFQQTIKFACLKYYKMKSREMKWERINMECPVFVDDENDNLLKHYLGKKIEIKSFMKKEEKFAKIGKRTITIENLDKYLPVKTLDTPFPPDDTKTLGGKTKKT